MSPSRPSIVLLAGEGTSSAVLYGLYDVLFSVGAIFADMTIGIPGSEALDVRIVSKDGKPFHCFGGIPVEPHAGMSAVTHCDLLVVCDSYSPIDRPPRAEYAIYSDWLRQRYAGGSMVTSVCSGTLVLAEAGLLDNRKAASHWAYAELFAKEYPRVSLQRGSILCVTEEKDRIVTAGGVTSWQELALYIIARFCGTEAALQTAKVHLLSGHEQGQLPFAAINRRVDPSDGVITRCQEWIAVNYAAPNPVQAMTGLSGLPSRTFARRFQSATGRSPINYVQALRIEEAKQMLETSSSAIEDISAEVGYQDSAAFRRTFRKLCGITPANYRRRFSRLV
ncbi:GlxA family transcriptional regulator [Aestuariivirga sp.]|uniref:GlxA family transcriptional regulator n=1 Tax=Aestuariivirga sp. TaxID=2650926 RepID=UPI0039E54676